jgi:SAM-dependent methyltransferase
MKRIDGMKKRGILLTDSAQHKLEIYENSQLWNRKPLLAKIYACFYEEIAKRLDRSVEGMVVELGSGMGAIKMAIPECVTTDIFPNPWVDRVENAYALSFSDNTVSNLILCDVWHHLEFPGTALQEFRRVLVEGGRLIILDPAMGLLGRFVYGLFHREPLGLCDKVHWEAPEGFLEECQHYFAAQGRASLIFESGQFEDRLKDWGHKDVVIWSALDYLASGGFRGPQLYPASFLPFVRGIDRILSCFPKLFGSRMIVVLCKQ